MFSDHETTFSTYRDVLVNAVLQVYLEISFLPKSSDVKDAIFTKKCLLGENWVNLLNIN